MYAEYIAKIKGDISALDKTIREAQGKIQRLNDDEVLIKFNYDGNAKQFNKVFQSILNKHPELSVQLQYDLNKKFLDQKMDELKDLETLKMKMDPSDIEGELTDVNEKIDKTRANIEMINDELKRLSSSYPDLGLEKQLSNTQAEAQNTAESFEKVESSLTETRKSLDGLYDGFKSFYELKGGGDVSAFWERLKENIDRGDEELKELLADWKLLNEEGSLSTITNGAVNNGGVIGAENVLIARTNSKDKEGRSLYSRTNELKKSLDDAYASGVNVARILDIIGDEQSKVFFEIQDKAFGNPLGSYGLANDNTPSINPDFLQATDEQILKLYQDIKKLNDLGIGVDINPENILYDKEKGFSLIDLDLKPALYKDQAELIEDILGGTVRTIQDFYKELNDSSGNAAARQFEDRMESVAESFEEVEQAADRSIKATQQSNSPAKEGKERGSDLGDGYAEGIRESIPEVEKAASDMTQAALDITDKATQAQLSKKSAQIDYWTKRIETLYQNPDYGRLNEDMLYSEMFNAPEVQELISVLSSLSDAEQEALGIHNYFDDVRTNIETVTERVKNYREEMAQLIKDGDDAGAMELDEDLYSSMSELLDIAERCAEVYKTELNPEIRDFLDMVKAENENVFNSHDVNRYVEEIINGQKTAQEAFKEMSFDYGWDNESTRFYGYDPYESIESNSREAEQAVASVADSIREEGIAASISAEQKEAFAAANRDVAKSAKESEQAEENLIQLFEDSSGQYSFIENLANAEKELSNTMDDVAVSAKEASEQIEGQLSLDFSNTGSNASNSNYFAARDLAMQQEIADSQKRYKASVKETTDAILEQTNAEQTLASHNKILSDNLADAYAQYAEELTTANARTKEFEESIREVVNLTRSADSSGSSLSLLGDLQEEVRASDAAKKSIEGLIKTLKGLEDTNKYTKDFVDNAAQLQAKLEDLSHEDIITPSQVEELKKAVDGLKEASKLDVNKNFKELSKTKYLDQISQYLSKYTGLSKETRRELEGIADAMKKANSAGELKDLYDQFIKLRTGARDAGEEIQSMFTKIGNRLTDMNAKFIAQFFSFQDIIRYIRELSQNVVAIDSALTELRKVSDASTSRLQQSFQKSSETALELGQSIEHVVNVTADWARLNKLGLFA